MIISLLEAGWQIVMYVCLTLQIGALVNTIMLIGVLLMLVIMDVGVNTAKETHRLSATISPFDDDYENINEDPAQSSFELLDNNIGMGKKGIGGLLNF